ncbi:MAG: dodecin [Alphaproteobacteria bacterium]
MNDNVYAVTEIVGSSKESMEDAIRSAVATASKTLRNLEWFEVTETRGYIEKDRVAYFQVMLKIGFRYDK